MHQITRYKKITNAYGKDRKHEMTRREQNEREVSEKPGTTMEASRISCGKRKKKPEITD